MGGLVSANLGFLRRFCPGLRSNPKIRFATPLDQHRLHFSFFSHILLSDFFLLTRVKIYAPYPIHQHPCDRSIPHPVCIPARRSLSSGLFGFLLTGTVVSSAEVDLYGMPKLCSLHCQRRKTDYICLSTQRSSRSNAAQAKRRFGKHTGRQESISLAKLDLTLTANCDRLLS